MFSKKEYSRGGDSGEMTKRDKYLKRGLFITESASMDRKTPSLMSRGGFPKSEDNRS